LKGSQRSWLNPMLLMLSHVSRMSPVVRQQLEYRIHCGASP